MLKAVLGIRVSASEEIEGLDIGEHGMEAYPGFAGDATGEPAAEFAAAGVPAGRTAVVHA